MDKVAIGRVVLTNREHIIALEPMDKGLMGTLLRYPYEVRDLRTSISTRSRTSKSPRTCSISPGTSSIRRRATSSPDKFEDQYETALVDLINQKRAGKPITAKERPRGENVVDLMDALRKSIGGARRLRQSRRRSRPRRRARRRPGRRKC